MERERFEQELLEFVEGRLGGHRADAVREKLAHDDAMRARVEGMRRNRELLMREPKEQSGAEGVVGEAISQAEREALVGAQRAGTGGGHSVFTRLVAAAALIAVATVGAGGIWWLTVQSEKPSEETPSLAGVPEEEPFEVDDAFKSLEYEAAVELAVSDSDSGFGAYLPGGADDETLEALAVPAKDETITIDDIGIFAIEVNDEVGPAYNAGIEEGELGRAALLARADRLVLVVRFEWAAFGGGADALALGDGGSFDGALVERVEPWKHGPGLDLADEAPGMSAAPEEGAVANEDADTGLERFVVWGDARVGVRDLIKAFAERVRDAGGMVEVVDVGGKAGQAVWSGEASLVEPEGGEPVAVRVVVDRSSG